MPIDSHPQARRRSVRVIGPFTARWLGVSTVALVVHDLSVGGGYILSARALQPTEWMMLEIDLPDGTTIAVKARPLQVRRSHGIAVEFVEVPATTLRTLQHNIAALEIADQRRP